MVSVIDAVNISSASAWSEVSLDGSAESAHAAVNPLVEGANMQWQPALTRLGLAILAVIEALWQAFHGLIGQSPLEAENSHTGVRTDGAADQKDDPS